jgi:hypothetical protein
MKLYIGEVRVKATRKGMDKGKCNCGAWLCQSVRSKREVASCNNGM